MKSGGKDGMNESRRWTQMDADRGIAVTDVLTDVLRRKMGMERSDRTDRRGVGSPGEWSTDVLTDMLCLSHVAFVGVKCKRRSPLKAV